MCEKFLAISAEKQRAILKAALSEFSERGYPKPARMSSARRPGFKGPSSTISAVKRRCICTF